MPAPGFAKIAAHSGAAVIQAYVLSDEKRGPGCLLRFNARVAITGDAKHDAASLHAASKPSIRANPDQWLWLEDPDSAGRAVAVRRVERPAGIRHEQLRSRRCEPHSVRRPRHPYCTQTVTAFWLKGCGLL